MVYGPGPRSSDRKREVNDAVFASEVLLVRRSPRSSACLDRHVFRARHGHHHVAPCAGRLRLPQSSRPPATHQQSQASVGEHCRHNPRPALASMRRHGGLPICVRAQEANGLSIRAHCANRQRCGAEERRRFISSLLRRLLRVRSRSTAREPGAGSACRFTIFAR